MEIYTSLETAVMDTSLVIITDQIPTRKELDKTYLRYKTLSPKQRRFSNYYSCEFLGRNVPDMYDYVKDQLTAEKDSFIDRQLEKDKYILSEPDLYYKEASFNSGDTNICFILGHSGSGKSSMARALEGDEIEHIELDDLLLIKDHFSMDDLKDYSGMFYDFFNGEGAKYYIGLDERNSIPREEYEDRVFIDFVHFALDYAGQHKEKKYIIEGIWIYLYFEDPSEFEDYAVFIKGTSFLKSKIRMTKREMQRDREDAQKRKQMFERGTRNYLLDEDKIDSYRDFFGGRPETVYREEQSEEEKQEEAAVNELNSINRCFVYNDANGIVAIRKKAEANTELSGWNRMRIIAECEAALLEL